MNIKKSNYHFLMYLKAAFSMVLVTLFAFGVLIETAAAQYTSTIIYDSASPPTLPGGETISSDDVDVSINSNGAVAWSGSISGGSLTTTRQAIFRSDGQAGGQVDMLYQAVAPTDADCILSNTANCLESPLVVATTFMGPTIINDTGEVAFLNVGSTVAFETRREIVAGDGTGTASIRIQNADDGAGSVYSDLWLTDFNNLGFAVSNMTASCPAQGGFSVGVSGDGSLIGSATFGGIAVIAPPGISFFNECLEANVTYRVWSNFVIKSNTNHVYVVAERQEGTNTPEIGLFVYAGTAPSFLYVVAETPADIAVNNQGSMVYAGSHASGNSVFPDLILIDASGPTPITKVIASTDPNLVPNVIPTDRRTWLAVGGGGPTTMAINSSGLVAFLATENNTGEGIWVYDPIAETVTRVGGASTLSKNGFNDAGEIVARTTFFSGGVQRTLIGKYSPPAPAAPEIAVAPMAIDFGQLQTGQSATETIVVNNSGADPLIVSSVVAPTAPFSITSDACSGTSVATGASCSVDVSFAPVAASTFNDQLSIISNDADEAAVVVSLAGSAVQPPPPVVLSITDSVPPVDDNAIDFGSRLVNETRSATFTISNDGTGAVLLGLVSTSADAAGVFSIPVNNDNCSNVTLDPTDTCRVVVQFESAVAGSFTAVADIVIASGGTLQVDLSGTANVRQFDLALSKTASVSTLARGSGELVEYTITVTNSGPDTIREPTVTDLLPPYLVLVGTPVCGDGAGGTSCFMDGQGNWGGVWLMGGLAAAQSVAATAMFAENIPAGAADTCLVNRVEVQEQGDTDSSNNVATALVGGGNCADLVLTAQISGQAASQSMATVSATGTITNNGPNDIAAVTISGLADFGLGGTAATVSITSVTGCSNVAPTGEDTAFVCEVGSLASGSSVDIAIAGEVTSSAAFTVNYTVTVGGSDDPDSSNNEMSDSRLINLQQPPPANPPSSGGGGTGAPLLLLLGLAAGCRRHLRSKACVR